MLSAYCNFGVTEECYACAWETTREGKGGTHRQQEEALCFVLRAACYVLCAVCCVLCCGAEHSIGKWKFVWLCNS